MPSSSTGKLVALLNQLRMINVSIGAINKRLGGSVSDNEEARLRRERRKLREERLRLERLKDNYLAGTAGIKTPSPQDIAKLTELVGRVDQATTNSQRQQAGLRMVSDLIDLAGEFT